MKKIPILILMMALVFPALAQEKGKVNPNAPDPEKIPVLQKIKEQGENLAYDYLGRRFGTDTWLITGPGVMQVIYTVPNGVAAVVGGVLVGPDGQEISTAMQREFTEANPERAQKLLEQARQSVDTASAETPGPKPSPSETIWTQLAQLGLITYAARDIDAPVPIVYAVLDPDQAESGETFLRLLPLAESGRIVLHVVPLLTRRADRLLDMAHILSSPEDAPALWQKAVAQESFNIPQTVDPKGAEALNANASFAAGLKLYTVPFLFYRIPEAEGWSRVRAVKGMPKDWETLLKEWESPGN